MMRRRNWGLLGIWLLSASAQACSGSDAGPAASAGAGAGGSSANGSAGAAGRNPDGGGTGAGPTGVRAQAGLTLSVMPPMPPVDQMACPVTKQYEIGTPAPTSTDPGTSAIDAQDGAVISCSVSGGPAFTFSAKVNRLPTAGNVVSVAISNGAINPDDTGTMDMVVYTPELSANFASVAPCTVQVLSQQIKPGSLWLSFACPQVASPPSGLCGLSGTLVLENCSGTRP